MTTPVYMGAVLTGQVSTIPIPVPVILLLFGKGLIPIIPGLAVSLHCLLNLPD